MKRERERDCSSDEVPASRNTSEFHVYLRRCIANSPKVQEVRKSVKEGKKFSCWICNLELPCHLLEVDHVIPLKALMEKFLSQVVKKDLDEILIRVQIDQNGKREVAITEPRGLENQWLEFHEQNCQLAPCCSGCNKFRNRGYNPQPLPFSREQDKIDLILNQLAATVACFQTKPEPNSEPAPKKRHKKITPFFFSEEKFKHLCSSVKNEIKVEVDTKVLQVEIPLFCFHYNSDAVQSLVKSDCFIEEPTCGACFVHLSPEFIQEFVKTKGNCVIKEFPFLEKPSVCVREEVRLKKELKDAIVSLQKKCLEQLKMENSQVPNAILWSHADIQSKRFWFHPKCSIELKSSSYSAHIDLNKWSEWQNEDAKKQLLAQGIVSHPLQMSRLSKATKQDLKQLQNQLCQIPIQ